MQAALHLLGDRCNDLGVAVAERCDSEAARQVKVFTTVCVDDATALRFRPDHGFSLFSVSSAM
jgi:hypothetical protein